MANQFVDGFNCGVGDFIFAYVLMAGVGLAYKLVTKRAVTMASRLGAGLALATAFLLVWINAAGGIIGSEDNPANLMHGGVLVIGFIGACLAQFAARGMARALFAAAFAQACVPVIALMSGRPISARGVGQVFVLNPCFAGSALLFDTRRAR
ncbi:MAG: hypothetical protein ACREIA_00580 [Opitutaceae bacterium]